MHFYILYDKYWRTVPNKLASCSHKFLFILLCIQEGKKVNLLYSLSNMIQILSTTLVLIALVSLLTRLYICILFWLKAIMFALIRFGFLSLWIWQDVTNWGRCHRIICQSKCQHNTRHDQVLFITPDLLQIDLSNGSAIRIQKLIWIRCIQGNDMYNI